MTSTKEDGLNGKFDAEQVEPLIKQLRATIDGVPANLAGMAVISLLLELSKLEAEAAGETDFGGFEMNCRVKDFHVTVRAERNQGGLIGVLQELLNRGEATNGNAGLGALIAAAAAAKDDPESEDYCECEACNERRAVMAEYNKKPSTH